MTDRDPVQEAVERGAEAWIRASALSVRYHQAKVVLDAALAPYGGLEAINKLEAVAASEAEHANAMAIIKATWPSDDPA